MVSGSLHCAHLLFLAFNVVGRNILGPSLLASPEPVAPKPRADLIPGQLKQAHASLRRHDDMPDLQGLFSEKAHFLRFFVVCATVVSGCSPHFGQQLVVLLEFPPQQL